MRRIRNTKKEFTVLFRHKFAHLYAGKRAAVNRLGNSFVYITGKRIKDPIFRCDGAAKLFIWLFIELTAKVKPIVRI